MSRPKFTERSGSASNHSTLLATSTVGVSRASAAMMASAACLCAWRVRRSEMGDFGGGALEQL